VGTCALTAAPSFSLQNQLRLPVAVQFCAFVSVHTQNMSLIPTIQDRTSCSNCTLMNDNSEGHDIDEGNEVEQDASGSASVSTYSRQTPQRERIRRTRKIMGSVCWTS